MSEFTGTLSTKTGTSKQTIFVVRNFCSNLLGLPAIRALDLLVRIAEVSEDYSSIIQKKYPNVFTGLGTVQGDYTIKLQTNAKPHAICVAHNVPYPYVKKFKQN